MGHQSPHYLKLKGKTYYFSRRVPKELQKHSKCSRFEICLRTSVKSVAIKQAMQMEGLILRDVLHEGASKGVLALRRYTM